MEPGGRGQVHEAGVWGRWGGDKACLAVGPAVEVSRSWAASGACREQEVWLEPRGGTGRRSGVGLGEASPGPCGVVQGVSCGGMTCPWRSIWLLCRERW